MPNNGISSSSVVLNSDLRSAFDDDGYMIFDSGVETSHLDGVLLDLRGKYNDPQQIVEGVVYTAGRIQDAWKVSPHVKAIALAPKILSLLEQLYDRRPLPFQTLNFPKGTEQAAHSDTVHFNSMPAGYMCGVWVALEDIDFDMGPLMYFKGSHKLPEIGVEDLHRAIKFMLTPYYEFYAKVQRRFGFRTGPTPLENTHGSIYLPYYEPFIAEAIQRHGMTPTYATIKKGQALVWAANLLHGGSYQRNRSRSRHSQVTHYFFEGCRYYTPLLQRRTAMLRKQIYWRNPQPIS